MKRMTRLLMEIENKLLMKKKIYISVLKKTINTVSMHRAMAAQRYGLLKKALENF